MKHFKKIWLLVLLSFKYSYSQVGIGTVDVHPNAVLELKSTTKGLLLPRLTNTQLNNIANKTPEEGLIVFCNNCNPKGIYLYSDGKFSPFATNSSNTDNINSLKQNRLNIAERQELNNNEKTNALTNLGFIGDIKYGLQTNDHNGWVKLDNRSLELLTPSQKAAATALGLKDKLPDMRYTYISLNPNEPLGSIYSNNWKEIKREHLPNIILKGQTSNSGLHKHSSGAPSYEAANGHEVRNGLLTGVSYHDDKHTYYPYTTQNGAHTHSFESESLNGNKVQSWLEISPRTLSANVFVFLGE